MRQFVYILILFSSCTGYSQNILGKWSIIDVVNNAIISYCGPVSKQEADQWLKQEYIGASIEFLSSQKLIYRDKNNQIEQEKNTILFQYQWRLANKSKFELVESSTNKTLKRITLEYKDDKIFFDFIGIMFVLEKTD